MKNFALGLSLLAGACALAMPATSQAGNVGYFKNEGACTGFVGNPSAAITAAGHTPVAVAALDAPSLAPLDGLVYDYFCAGAFVGNSAIDNAVANGMALFLNLHLDSSDTNSASQFPGTPAIAVTYACGTGDTNLAPGSPIVNGLAGTLTDTNLDSTSGFCGSSGYVSSGLLLGGFIPLLTANGQTTAFSYRAGSGRVVIGLTAMQIGLPGGLRPGSPPGTEILYSNVVQWMLGDVGATATCASEGYKGAQLTWCKNICENGLSGQVLDTWIHRWINRYRDLPYCAVETPSNPG